MEKIRNKIIEKIKSKKSSIPDVVKALIAVVIVNLILTVTLVSTLFPQPDCEARNVFWFSGKEEILKRENVKFKEQTLQGQHSEFCDLLISEKPVNYFGYDATLIYSFYKDKMIQITFLIDCADNNEYNEVSLNLNDKLGKRYSFVIGTQPNVFYNVFLVEKKKALNKDKECTEEIHLNFGYAMYDFIYKEIFGEDEYNRIQQRLKNTVVIEYFAATETKDYLLYQYYSALSDNLKYGK